MRSDFKIIFSLACYFHKLIILICTILSISIDCFWRFSPRFAIINLFSKYHTRNNKQRRTPRAPAAERVQSSIKKEKNCLHSSFLCFIQTKNEIWTVTKWSKGVFTPKKKQKSILWWFDFVLPSSATELKKSLITINYFSIFIFFNFNVQ